VSIFESQDVPCPKCGEQVHVEVNFSVNADRRPEFREAILDGTFQRHECPSCETSFRVEPEITYFEQGRRQWILVKPARELDQWEDLEKMADVIFDANFGPRAMAAARAVGRGLDARVTFGWPALREKLVLAELGLDDTAVELLKLELLRSDDSPPLADDLELRLLGKTDETLQFVWINANTEEISESVDVPAAALAAYDPVPAPWAALAERLTAGPFRDMHRLLVEPA